MTDNHPWVQHYQPGVPAEIEIPDTSLVEMCQSAVAAGDESVALQFFGRETTYRQLGDEIARAAEGLRRLGDKAGDRVALILPNCPQHVVAFYAALRLGRSEEHTSELQSRGHLVCRLLLAKKKAHSADHAYAT